MDTKHLRAVAPSGNVLETLLVVFLTLKISGLVSWSWWFVLSPIWLPAAPIVVLLAVLWVIRRAA